MIHLFSDFGLEGPYIGQVKAVLHRASPEVVVVDLCSDLAPFNPRAAAYMLAAYDQVCQPGDVVLGVVDPGVGGPREALALEVDGVWYVGPDNGIFDIVERHAKTTVRHWQVIWRPPAPSASFHGRDIFAPIGAELARGAEKTVRDAARFRPLSNRGENGRGWPDDLAEIVYVDRFGNLITGLRSNALAAAESIVMDGVSLPKCRTFLDVPKSQAFCYENSNGLMEIAINQGRADEYFGVGVGNKITLGTC